MSNSWWQIQVVCEPELEESIFWRLDGFGCAGTSTEVKGDNYLISGYIEESEVQLLDLSALSLWLRQDALVLGVNTPQIQWHLIDDEDWSSNWKQSWEPQEIGDRFLIYPAWLELPQDPERLILRLDPGVAFGTGSHATTQLCLESLEMRLSWQADQQIIADIGCGSGILSIGAVLLGAKQVYGVDVDPLAVRASCENQALNDISNDKLVFKRGSLAEIQTLVPEGVVDGIVCNILAEVIIDLIPQMESITKISSWAILSGILLEQVKPIADTLEQNGWIIATLWKRGEWCCFNVRRS